MMINTILRGIPVLVALRGKRYKKIILSIPTSLAIREAGLAGSMALKIPWGIPALFKEYLIDKRVHDSAERSFGRRNRHSPTGFRIVDILGLNFVLCKFPPFFTREMKQTQNIHLHHHALAC